MCLESILNQTFTDFELLVVDDCSTDSSAAIAESYLERFGGRLKIISLPKNTGSDAVPRNVGLDLSQGKYVYFVDNDDMLIDNALETLYDFAEKYQADVVCMERAFTCDENPIPKELNDNISYIPPRICGFTSLTFSRRYNLTSWRRRSKVWSVTKFTKFSSRNFQRAKATTPR